MVDHIQIPTPEMMVDHLDSQVSTLLRENEQLRAVLKMAKEKVQIYYECSDQIFQGGVPYDMLIERIDAALKD